VTVYRYRPSRSPYGLGAPIRSLAALLEGAQALYAEMPVTWSAWPSDDNPWATTSSGSAVALHTAIRLPVLPWVAELRAVITAQDAGIALESGTEVLFHTAAPETREVVLTVTPGDAGSLRTGHQLYWRARTVEAALYGLALYLQPLAETDLPEGL
jgi:hypothetical protein